jgi:hypothetical protein
MKIPTFRFASNVLSAILLLGFTYPAAGQG